MTKKHTIADDYVKLAKLALSGRTQDVQLLLRKTVKKYNGDAPELTDPIANLLKEAPTRSSPLRKQADAPLPVDLDSRLQLLKVENIDDFDKSIVLPPEIESSLQQLIKERENSKKLVNAGLEPTKTILFTGKPGVGKTLAAKWLAYKLKKPLLVLDLAAVMSSFLGRTGNNLRHVLDYAKSIDCILLIDELDAIAKRRDDHSEVGELKRLVTVLLQEFDDWPSSGILLSATNHPDLLDPAIWRRFEMICEFPAPDRKTAYKFIFSLIEKDKINVENWAQILSILVNGLSFSEIEHQVQSARRHALVLDTPIETAFEVIIQRQTASLSKNEKIEVFSQLINSKVMSQRQAHEVSGLARETLRKASQELSSKKKV